MPNITIHGKRTETIYAFTVEHEVEKITGRYIWVKEVDEDEPIPLNDFRIEFDPRPGTFDEYSNTILQGKIKQAIEDYEKTR
jgi:hypothetical protein